jgi:hypothetical protein
MDKLLPQFFINAMENQLQINSDVSNISMMIADNYGRI